MYPEKSIIEITEHESIKIAVLQNPMMLDEVDISEIGQKLSEIASDKTNKGLIVDFQNVNNMSSSALGMLITVQKRMREAKNELRLCNINDNIKEVFYITRLDEILTIDTDLKVSLETIIK